MAVLKAADLDRQTTRKEIFNLNDIAAEAEALIAQARATGKRLVAEAQEQAQRLRQEARQAGHEEGYRQGLTEGRRQGHEEALQQARAEFAEKNRITLRTLQAVLEQFDRNKQRLLWQAEQDTVALAVALAEKVIKLTGMLRAEVAAENLKAALELIGRRSEVTIYLNSRDIEHVRQMLQSEAVLEDFPSVHFRTRDDIEPGGCRLETGNGALDATLATQIRRLAEELLLSPDARQLLATSQARTGEGSAGTAPVREVPAREAPAAGKPAGAEEKCGESDRDKAAKKEEAAKEGEE